MNHSMHAFVTHNKSKKNTNKELKRQVNKILNDINADKLKSQLNEEVEKARLGKGYEKEMKKRKTRQAFSYKKVSELVADKNGIDPELLPMKTRKREVADSRQEICFVMYKSKSGFSLYEIGRYLGGRDHATIIHSYKKVKERIDIDNNYREYIKDIFLTCDPYFNFKSKNLEYLLPKD